MRIRTKTLVVAWEYVPDHDYREKLRQAFAIILGDNTRQSTIPNFDETRLLEQDQGEAKADFGAPP